MIILLIPSTALQMSTVVSKILFVLLAVKRTRLPPDGREGLLNFFFMRKTSLLSEQSVNRIWVFGSSVFSNIPQILPPKKRVKKLYVISLYKKGIKVKENSHLKMRVFKINLFTIDYGRLHGNCFHEHILHQVRQGIRLMVYRPYP